MSEKELWQDYLFITKEIEKFLMQQNFDMVNELLSQRENLQRSIENSKRDNYLITLEGKKLLEEINTKNRGMTQIIHMLRNKSQKKHAVANAYDRLGISNTGFSMDSKT